MISHEKKSKGRACSRDGVSGFWLHFSAFSPLGSPLYIGIVLRVEIRDWDCVKPHNQPYLEKEEESSISEMDFQKFGIFFLKSP